MLVSSSQLLIDRLGVDRELVLTPHDLAGLFSLLCQELIPGFRYRYILLQGELDERLGRYSYLVPPGDNFGSCARGGADARADCRTFSASGNGADDRSHRCSAPPSPRSARPARL